MAVQPQSVIPAAAFGVAGAAGTSAPRPLGLGRRRTRLTREGWYWLLAFVGLWVTGWLKGINLILLLAYLFLLLRVRGLRGLEGAGSVIVLTPLRTSGTGGARRWLQQPARADERRRRTRGRLG